MKDFSTDLSDLLGLTPPETENAAPAGTGSGVETTAAQKIAFAQDSKISPHFQAWAALDAAPQWCAWREERRGESWTKVPYSSPQRMARANDPATWLTRTRADAVAADLPAERLKGVGLFLGGAGDLCLGGIDLDSCLGLLGDLEPWAAEVLARFASYAEVSPSGTGAKVFFAYRAADLEPLRAIMGTKWGKSFSRGSHHEIALHLGNRYFTVTGQRLDSAPATIETVDRAALEWLITDAGPRFKGEEPAAAPKDESRSGRAFRIAGECRRAGLDLDAFKAELAKDALLAEWAKDARQVQRAWDRNAGEDLSNLLSDMDDFDDAPPETGQRNPVTALNRNHAAVMIGGKFRIIREKGSDYDIFAPEELHKLNANNRVKVPGEKRTEPVTSAWMRHPSRRTFAGGLVFNPKETPAGAYNVWRGWAVQPNPDASCGLFLAHVRDMICDGSEREFQWLLGWMAHLVQHPDQKPGTAVVLRGAKGAGKDTVGHYLGALFPRHHVTLSQPEHLTGRFNAHMETAILIHLEEGYWAGNHAAEGVLKNLITCQTLEVERKGIDPYKIDHFGRLLITSNAEWVVPATPGERRFFVLDVSPAHAKDTAYFGAIWKEQANGGAGALLHFLQSFDLGGFDVRNPPETAALTRQKLEGLRNVEAWWHDRLSEGTLSTDEFSEDRTDWEGEAITVSRAMLRRNYEDWLSRKRWHGNVASSEDFSKRLRILCSGLKDHRARVSGGRERQYVLPPLAECRAAFAEFIGGEMEWDQ